MSDGQRKNLPELRFPEFEQNWSKLSGDTITSKITKGSSPSWQGFEYQSTGVLFITSENVRDGYLDISSPKFLSPAFHEKQKNSQLRYGDILINIVGASIGRNCIYELEEPASTNQAVALFRVLSGHSFKFLSYCYQQQRIQRIVFGTQSESARPNLSLTDLKNLQFILPDLPEQRKIAAALQSVDDKLTQLRKKHHLLQEYKRGLMQQLFSQTLRFKQDDGRPFPDWEPYKLGEIATFQKGKGIAKSDISEKGQHLCIRYGQLYTDYNEVISEVISKTDKTDKNFVFSKKGDVIIPASGEDSLDIATAATVQVDGVILGGDLNVIRGDFNGIFLAYYLTNAKKRDIARLAQGISVIHLYGRHLTTLQISLPSQGEQQKIADCLTSIDSKIEAVANQISKIETFKKGLLQKMFV